MTMSFANTACWTKSRQNCPSGNSHILRRKLSHVTMSNSALANNTPIEDPGENVASPFKSTSETSLVHVSNHIDYASEIIRRMPIQDGFGSKLRNIVCHNAYLVQEDSSVKCLVFSQWATLLNLIGESLNNKQIGFVRLDGASARTAVKELNHNAKKHVFMLRAKSQIGWIDFAIGDPCVYLRAAYQPCLEGTGCEPCPSYRTDQGGKSMESMNYVSQACLRTC